MNVDRAVPRRQRAARAAPVTRRSTSAARVLSSRDALLDEVIQRLFAVGLKVQALRLAEGLGGDRLGEAVDGVVEDLDETIANIRTAILD